MSATAVLGAAGPTGLECVKCLLELGQPVVAVVRNPDKYTATFPSDKNLQIKKGDVTDIQGLQDVLANTKSKKVIFAASGKGYFSAKDVDEKVHATLAETHMTCFLWPCNVISSSQKVTYTDTVMRALRVLATWQTQQKLQEWRGWCSCQVPLSHPRIVSTRSD